MLLAASTAVAQAQYANPNGSQSNAQNPPRYVSKTGCPWLTQGSAAKALGGEVSVTVDVSHSDEGVCKFSSQSGPPDSLEILVSKAVLPACPPESTELKGIGNQATRCSHPGTHGQAVEMVSSRVRDIYFTVTHASRAKKSDPQDDALEQIAEQVAGNLY